MSKAALMLFWSSILDDDVIQEKLLSVMTIEDKEERVLQLLTRTLFLLVMGIKHERDGILKLRAVQNVAKDYGSRSGTTANDDRNSVDQGKFEAESNDVDILHDGESNLDMKMVPVTKDGRSLDEKIYEGFDDSCDINVGTESSRNELKAQKIAKNSYRSLSRLSPKQARQISDSDEVSEKHLQAEEPKILAPETLALDENELYVDTAKRKNHVTQTTVVPETLALESLAFVEKDSNSDFFESSIIGDDNSPKKQTGNLSINPDNERELLTPSKGKTFCTESMKLPSPILGYQNRSVNLNTKLDVPKALNFEGFVKEPPKAQELNITDSQEVKIITPSSSTPRYSPLVFTKNISSSQNDSDSTSPSLLPAFKQKVLGNLGVEKVSSPPVAITSDNEQPLSKLRVRSRRALKKSLSIASFSPPERKTHVLKRYGTTDKQSKGPAYELTIEPADSKKRIYRQTKISASSFQQKTDIAKITGGIPKRPLDPLDEDAALSAAMEESLKTKAIDDMLREKREALQTLKNVTVEVEVHTEDGIPKDQHQNKGRKMHSSSKKKENESPSVESPIKLLKLSPLKCRRSPRKKKLNSPEKPVNSSSSKRRKVEQLRKSDPESEDILALDQLLERVNESPLVNDQSVTLQKESLLCKDQLKKTSDNKTIGKKRKNFVIDNSFDIIPVKEEEPQYAYRGEVVRKKGLRKQLEGWECHECKEWYEAQNLNPEQKKMMLKRCSRHRGKHNPVTNTPENFWNPDWIDD